ncbi:hypothetical protein ADP71_30250 [Vitreoscilla sp. C1]|uniref:DUF262 domain-containing protein n=1 Tax=Vitreoscilla sp. (strain C1) TaxID=96942 RepID=UPI00148E96E8|nr:DUF262 domain-containing protein [Vitreoscilla sp. C1]AUZ06223.2 hypothetical protein ADP71_30250 [Vitreoscilla sp. C1]
MKVLEAQTKTLEYLLNLSSGVLSIPYSQRPYEWKEEQVRRLFNDFYSVFISDDSSRNHILNFITIRIDDEDTDKKYIYDGQQRTVTSLLILAALIRKLRQVDDSDAVDSANQLKQLYLYNQNWKDVKETKYKIVFNSDAANQMLHEYVFKGQELEDNYELTDYDKSIYDNFNFINKLIDESSIGKNANRENLSNFIATILDRVLIIIIETSYENIAEDMFETLNSTGLQIEDFYVLKNTLIQTLGEDTVPPLWSAIEINTDRINKGKFLHSYLNAINGKENSDNLYQKIFDLKKLHDPKFALNFLNELKKASDVFMKIDSPEQRIESDVKETSLYLKNIRTLKNLSANQYKPVIIAMGLQDYGTKEINLVLKEIISLQLRNIFISEERSNSVEKFYPTLAKSIYSRQIKSIDEIIDSIKSIMKDDSSVYNKFLEKQITSKKDESIIRFILKEIYDHDQLEISINTNSIDVNLEHILPVKPNENSKWLLDFPNQEDRIKLTRTIGNLTVLHNKLNTAAKNNDFEIKKTKYRESVIPQNILIAENSTWEEVNIKNRTHDLANAFMKIWKK